MISIEDNLKQAEDFYKKAEEVIKRAEQNHTIYRGNSFSETSSYLNLALYHQNQAIIQLLSNITKSPGINNF